VLRRIERSLVRAGAADEEKTLVVRIHPEVALQVLEEEPDFVKRLARRTRLELYLRDDPLLREDEFRLLSGPAEADVTDRYVVR
jgi:ribonuclease G